MTKTMIIAPQQQPMMTPTMAPTDMPWDAVVVGSVFDEVL
jgi:hypothetical protein